MSGVLMAYTIRRRPVVAKGIMRTYLVEAAVLGVLAKVGVASQLPASSEYDY